MLPIQAAQQAVDRAQATLDREIRIAIQDYGYTDADLHRQGQSKRAAAAARRRHGKRRRLGLNQVVQVPVDPTSDVVALVASHADTGHGAWRTINNHGAYLRAEGLALPVWPEASHLATDLNSRITEIFRIAYRFRVGSIANSSLTAQHPRSRQLTSDSFVRSTWDACDVLLLEPCHQVDLAVGDGAGIPGTRHYRRDPLLAATHLADVLTVNQGG